MLLTGLNLLNYMDRLVVSAVLTQIQTRLNMHSDARLVCLATIFLIRLLLTSPIFGLLGRPRKAHRSHAIGIVVWSAATIASGLAHDKTSLFIARAFVGVGEASYATIAPTIIDDLAPPEKKGNGSPSFTRRSP